MVLSICPNPSIDCYAWIDDFKMGNVNRFSRIEEFPGGKGVHVALALAELGAESKVLGFWAGNSGGWLKEECQKRAVQVEGIEIEGNNRRCYTFISHDPDLNHTELLEPGPVITKGHFERFVDKMEEVFVDAEFISMSGSWASMAPDNGYRKLILLAKKQQKKVILDCTGNQLEEALEEGFFGLHLNHKEAKTLCGSTDIKSLRNFLGDKVELIALTKGSEGLELDYKSIVIKAKINIEPAKIISTVGSGDCLTAGILYALNKKLTLKEIATWGVACGTANCLNKDLGMLKKEDVESLIKKVKIETNV